MRKYEPDKDFPEDLAELCELMAHWGHEMVEGYDLEKDRGKPFNEQDLIALLFVRSVVNIATSSPPSLFVRESIDRAKRRKLKNPRYRIDPTNEIVEEMLDAGIAAEKISELVTDQRKQCAREILYLLCDPTNELEGTLGDSLNIGLFLKDADGKPIPKSDAAFALLHTRFYEARPDLDIYHLESSN